MLGGQHSLLLRGCKRVELSHLVASSIGPSKCKRQLALAAHRVPCGKADVQQECDQKRPALFALSQLHEK